MDSTLSIQWDISHSIFGTFQGLRELVRAGSMDDVQCQAILAFERLGGGIIVWNKRIAEAVDALGGRKDERLAQGKLVVGLSGDGLVRVMKKSPGCVKAFLLTIACKTCYHDSEIADILFNMIAGTGILDDIPVSPFQLSSLLSAVSGYGDALVPCEVFSDITSRVHAQLDYSYELPGLFDRLSPEVIASILNRVFLATKNMEIEQITVEGSYGALWLSSALAWLDPQTLQVTFRETLVYGNPLARVVVQLACRSDSSWLVQEWTVQGNIAKVIVTAPKEEMLGERTDFYPRSSARCVLSSQYNLCKAGERALASTVGALVEIAFESGNLMHRRKPGNVTGYVPLSEICTDGFLKDQNVMLRQFGWASHIDKEFFEQQRAWVMALSELFVQRENDNKFNTDAETFLSRFAFQPVLQKLAQPCTGTCLSCKHSRDAIVEPAIFLAADILLLSICQQDMKAEYFRGCTHSRLQPSYEMVRQLIRKPGKSDRGLQMLDLQHSSMKLMLPKLAHRQIDPRDLAISDNGYVAYYHILRQPISSRRTCCHVCVLPGSIRSEDLSTQFQLIRQQVAHSKHFESPGPTSAEDLDVFREARYLGLEPRSDPDRSIIETLISHSGHMLFLQTRMKALNANVGPVGLDWIESMEAVIFATHIQEDHSMSTHAEELLAKEWHRVNFIERIKWVRPRVYIADAYSGCIVMSSGNEALRFFSAGRHNCPKLYIRHRTPLVQCIQRIVSDSSGEDVYGWTIIA